MYNMNEELMDFVKWLPNNSELFADMDVEAIIAQINDLASSDEGKEILEQLTKQYKSKEMGLFKKGGKLNYLLCLKKGGKVQDCGCGKKIEKAQGGSDGLRERGSVNAYDERYPEFNRDSTWSVVSTPNGPAYVKNVFSGNTLEQNVVTEGINGVPRRTIRSITSYDNPAESDTTYIDANGLEAGRNPGMLARLFGNVHSDKFMDNIDSILVGMEPRQLSEKEVDRTKKKQDGGEISRKEPGGEIPNMVSVYPIRRWNSTGFFSGDKTASLKAYDPKQRFLGVDYDNDSLGYLNRTISGNDTTYVGKGPVAAVLMGKPIVKIKATSKNSDDPNLPRLRAIFKQFGD